MVPFIPVNSPEGSNTDEDSTLFSTNSAPNSPGCSIPRSVFPAK